MAPQVTRFCIVYGCLVFGFLGLRSVMVPESFGKTGHFRQAALGMLAAHPAKFEGKQPCIDCHANNTPHTDKGVSCESCHGPGAAHTKDFDSAKLKVDNTRAACGACHSMNSAKRATFPQVDMSDHYPKQRCVECHKIHPEDTPKPADAAKPTDTAKPADAAKTPAVAKPTEALAAKGGK